MGMMKYSNCLFERNKYVNDLFKIIFDKKYQNLSHEDKCAIVGFLSEDGGELIVTSCKIKYGRLFNKVRDRGDFEKAYSRLRKEIKDMEDLCSNSSSLCTVVSKALIYLKQLETSMAVYNNNSYRKTQNIITDYKSNYIVPLEDDLNQYRHFFLSHLKATNDLKNLMDYGVHTTPQNIFDYKANSDLASDITRGINVNLDELNARIAKHIDEIFGKLKRDVDTETSSQVSEEPPQVSSQVSDVTYLFDSQESKFPSSPQIDKQEYEKILLEKNELQEKYNQLEKQLSDEKEEKDRLLALEKKSKQDCEDAKTKVNQAREDFENMYNDVKNKYDELQRKQELIDLHGEHCKEDLEKAKKFEEEAKLELSKCKEELEKCRKELDDCKQERKNIQDKLEENKQTIDELKAEKQDLQNKLTEAQNRIQELVKLHQSCLDDSAATTKLYEKANKDIAELQQKLDDCLRNSGLNQEDKDNIRERLTESLNECNKQSNYFKDAIAALEKEKNNLSEDNEEKQKTIEKLQGIIRTNEEQQKLFSDLKLSSAEDQDKLKKRIDELDKLLKERDDEIKNLTDKADICKSLSDKSQDTAKEYMTKIEALNKELSDKDDFIRKLQAQINDSHTNSDNIKNEFRNKLNCSSDDMLTCINEVKARLDGIDNMIPSEDYNNVLRNLKVLEQHQKSLEDAIKKSDETLLSRDQELVSSRDEKNKLQASLEDLAKSSRDKEKKLQDEEKKLLDSNTSLKYLAKCLFEKIKEVASYGKQKITDKKTDYNKIISDKTRLLDTAYFSADIYDCSELERELRSTIDDLANVDMKLIDYVHDLEDKLDSIKGEIHKLRKFCTAQSLDELDSGQKECLKRLIALWNEKESAVEPGSKPYVDNCQAVLSDINVLIRKLSKLKESINRKIKYLLGRNQSQVKAKKYWNELKDKKGYIKDTETTMGSLDFDDLNPPCDEGKISQYRDLDERFRYIKNLYENVKGIGRIYMCVKPLVDDSDPQNPVIVPDPESGFVSFIDKKGDVSEYGPFDGLIDNGDPNQMFNEVKDMVENMMSDTYNLVFLVYGQSGSGKTYSLFGPRGDGGLFAQILSMLRTTVKDLKVRLFQLYVDKLYDIYGEKVLKRKTIAQINEEFKLTQDVRKLEDIKSSPLNDSEFNGDVVKYFFDRRCQRETFMNPDSSRSNGFIELSFEGNNKKRIYILFGDLGGSERPSLYMQAGDKSQTATEGEKINQTLLSLGGILKEFSKGNPSALEAGKAPNFAKVLDFYLANKRGSPEAHKICLFLHVYGYYVNKIDDYFVEVCKKAGKKISPNKEQAKIEVLTYKNDMISDTTKNTCVNGISYLGMEKSPASKQRSAYSQGQYAPIKNKPSNYRPNEKRIMF